jgi:hypothetical protein
VTLHDFQPPKKAQSKIYGYMLRKCRSGAHDGRERPATPNHPAQFSESAKLRKCDNAFCPAARPESSAISSAWAQFFASVQRDVIGADS